MVLDDDDVEATAASFESEKTSPEVVRHGRRRLQVRDESKPVAVVGMMDSAQRAHIVELLSKDGWTAMDVSDLDELLEACRASYPHVVLLDEEFTRGDVAIGESILSQRPDAATRVVALLKQASASSIASALAWGCHDFITEPDNDRKILARMTLSLRSALTLEELHKQRRDAASLLELSQTLASSLDMQLILHTVTRLLADVIELERCSVVLLDPDRQSDDDDNAVMVAASEDRTVRDLRIQLRNYPELKRCVESAAPVLIENAEADPILAHVRGNVTDRGVKAMALFPIVFEERVTGVLFLRSTTSTRRLNDHEVQFGQTVAAACAVAIRNARLFDQFRDQTERVIAERRMTERQMEALRHYEDFFEYAADGMAIIDADGRLRYVNREGRKILGRTREELRTATFQSLLAVESSDRWNDVVDQVRHGRFKRSFDVFVARGDGSERILSLSAGGSSQQTGLIILSYRDVTETREMEGELRTTKEFLENLIDNSVDAIVAADMRGNIILFNKGAERIFGRTAAVVVDKMHVSQLYLQGMASDVMRKLRDERFGGRGRLEAHRREIVHAQGSVVPVSMTASIIYEDGEEVATVGVFTDLRDRLTIERRLSEAQDQLNKTEKARVAAELAGMAAHELNQPLTSVLGYAEMLKAKIPESDARLRRPVEIIFTQAERMAEIVRKIGRITKYETKRYGLNTDMIDLKRAAPDGDARQVTSQPPAFLDDDSSPSPAARASVMSSLASMPPRNVRESDSAVIRIDTLDEVPRHRRPPDPESTRPQLHAKVQAPPPRSSTIDLHDDEHTHRPVEETNPGMRVRNKPAERGSTDPGTPSSKRSDVEHPVRPQRSGDTSPGIRPVRANDTSPTVRPVVSHETSPGVRPVRSTDTSPGLRPVRAHDPARHDVTKGRG
jgi:PAS domain S-box-containing protein